MLGVRDKSGKRKSEWENPPSKKQRCSEPNIVSCESDESLSDLISDTQQWFTQLEKSHNIELTTMSEKLTQQRSRIRFLTEQNTEHYISKRALEANNIDVEAQLYRTKLILKVLLTFLAHILLIHCSVRCRIKRRRYKI